MKKNKFKLIFVLFLIPLLTYCGGVREAFEGKKRSDQSDEFLVKKKNPLQMPPDINKLPTPGNSLEIIEEDNVEEVKELLKTKENDNDVSNSGSDLLNNMKKKIQ